MNKCVNGTNEEVTVSFGPKGMTVTLSTSDGSSHVSTFGWGMVAQFVHRLESEFREEYRAWRKTPTTVSTPPSSG